MKRIVLSVALGAAFVSGFAVAAGELVSQAPKVSVVPNRPTAALATLEKVGMSVEKSFPVSEMLTGWVVQDKKKGGEYSVLYTTNDGSTLISGAVLDVYGKNLTAEHAERFIPKPDMTQAYAEIAKNATVIPTGNSKAKTTFYVFADPSCGYCHLAYKAFEVYGNDVQVNWIPVGFLAPDSTNKAAAALQGKTTWGALMNQKTSGDYSSFVIGAKAGKDVEKNTELMRKFGFQGTPGILWKGADGKIEVRKGMIRLSEIGQAAGVAVKKSDDPLLGKFN